ncbi:MAG: DNA polymerase, partial [Gammaproteobacteria bacterium]
PLDEVSGNERRAAKAINFGLMYGMSAFGLARQLGIARGEAQDYIGLYFSRYPGVRDFMDRTRQQARDQGYVETVFGRRLALDYINSRNPSQRAGAERAAINAPMQGTAADIIRRAMTRVEEALAAKKLSAQMLLQVHDELMFEVPQGREERAAEVVRQEMAEAAEPLVKLTVPLDVEVGWGAHWGEAH